MTHFQTLSFLQKAIECFEKIETKLVAVLYINEAIPGKLINLYDFKEESEILVFEFRNYKPPSQNELSFINEIKLSLNFFKIHNS